MTDPFTPTRLAAHAAHAGQDSHPRDISAAAAQTLRTRPVVRVRTKLDLIAAPVQPLTPIDDTEAIDRSKPPALAARTESRPAPATVRVCALDGRELDTLERALTDAIGERDPGALPSRHRALLHRAAGELAEAERLVGSGEDVTASAMRRALDSLGAITGAVTPDDVLGRIFASFCIGK